MIGIYCIENTANGLAYIGQSSDIKKRFAQHRSDLRGGRHVNSALQRAWEKYGEEAFVFSVVEEVPACDLDDAEIMWIEAFDSYIHGYNMTKGGESTRGLTPWNKGKTHSDETKKKISEMAKKKTGEKNPFFHRHHSEQTKAILRAMRAKPVIDPETGTIYPSAKYADAMFGGRSSNVNKVLTGGALTAYGIPWERL